jgi:hypothetical protein
MLIWSVASSKKTKFGQANEQLQSCGKDTRLNQVWRTVDLGQEEVRTCH